MTTNTKKVDNKQELEFQQRKDKFEKKLETWTQEEIEEHKRTVAKFYGTGTGMASLLGDFRHDKNNVYHWHVVTKDHENKIHRRFAVGWRLASMEDIEHAHITASSKYGEIHGLSGVIANHGADSKAILLKIPRHIHELNERLKHEANERNSRKDSKGVTSNYKEYKGNYSDVHHRDDGVVSVDDL